jgi:hypothetical protein
LNRRVTLEAALCLTAGILAASALVQATSLFSGAPNLSGMPLSSIANAQTAQMVAAGNGFSILSTNTSGEANVLVQDARAEELTVYRTDSQGLLTPVQRIRLQSVFVEGRARFGQQ